MANFSRALLLCTSITAVGFVANGAALAASSPEQTFIKKYNYCDAHILANYWNVDTYQAKVTGGQKIQDGNISTLKQVLAEARGQSQCDWGDTGYDYDDAVALTKYWGNTTDQAKAKIVAFFSRGQANLARQALKAAKKM